MTGRTGYDVLEYSGYGKHLVEGVCLRTGRHGSGLQLVSGDPQFRLAGTMGKNRTGGRPLSGNDSLPSAAWVRQVSHRTVALWKRYRKPDQAKVHRRGEVDTDLYGSFLCSRRGTLAGAGGLLPDGPDKRIRRNERE